MAKEERRALTITVHCAVRTWLLAVAFDFLSSALVAALRQHRIACFATILDVPCASYPPSLLHWPCGCLVWLFFGVIVDWRRLLLDVWSLFKLQCAATNGISGLDVDNRGGGSIHSVARRGSIADWGARKLRRIQSVSSAGLTKPRGGAVGVAIH